MKGETDRNGIMLVVVLSLDIVLVRNGDFGIFTKGNDDGGVRIYTTNFATHLESSTCAVESFLVDIFHCVYSVGTCMRCVMRYSSILRYAKLKYSTTSNIM